MRSRHGWAAGVGLALAGAAGCELVTGLKGDAKLGNPGTGGASGATATVGTTGTTGTAGKTSASSTAGATGATGTGGAAPVCKPGDTQPCYTGAPGTEDAGTCMGGTATCDKFGQWGACEGETVPQPRSCASTTDVACLGKDNCTQWAKLFGDLDNQQAAAVGVDGAGNVFVAGTFHGTIPLPQPLQPLATVGTQDVFVLKLSPAGTPIWGTSFGAANVTVKMQSGLGGLAVDAAGEAVITGTADGTLGLGGMSAAPGIWVAKLGADGTPIWGRGLTVNYNGKDGESVSNPALTPQGNVVLAGGFSSGIDFGDGPLAAPPTNGQYGFVAELQGSNGSGKKADGSWSNVPCSGTNTCAFASVATDALGNAFVAGYFIGVMNLEAGNPAGLLTSAGPLDMVMAKLTLNGSPTWQRQIKSSAMSGALPYAIGSDGSGGVIVAGSMAGTVDLGGGPVTAPTGSPNGFVAHYHMDDSYDWSNLLVGGTPHGVGADASGVFFAGSYNGPLDLGAGPLVFAGMIDAFVAKVSLSGKLLWAKGYGDSAEQYVTALALTPKGDPVIVGNTDSTTNFGTGPLMTAGEDDVFVVELSP